MFLALCSTSTLAHRARLLAFLASTDPSRRTDTDCVRLALFWAASGEGVRS